MLQAPLSSSQCDPLHVLGFSIRPKHLSEQFLDGAEVRMRRYISAKARQGVKLTSINPLSPNTYERARQTRGLPPPPSSSKILSYRRFWGLGGSHQQHVRWRVSPSLRDRSSAMAGDGGMHSSPMVPQQRDDHAPPITPTSLH